MKIKRFANAVMVCVFYVILFAVNSGCGVTEDKQSDLDDPKQQKSVYINSEVSLLPYLESDKKLTLNEQILSPWGFSIEVATVGGGNVSSVASCGDLFRADEYNKEPVRPHEFVPYRNTAMMCYATRYITSITASSHAMIGDIVLDEALADQLPVEVAFISSSVESARILKDPSKQYWSDVQAFDSVTAISSYQASFNFSGGSQELTVFARGDMNGDGVEDVLFRVVTTVEGGSYASTQLFLLSREKVGGPLVLISQHQ